MGTNVGTDTAITRNVLNQLAPDHPLIIEAFWGHVMYFNIAIIKTFKLAKNEPNVKGGIFIRYPGTQIINGRTHEYACNFLNSKKPTNEDLLMES